MNKIEILKCLGIVSACLLTYLILGEYSIFLGLFIALTVLGYYLTNSDVK